MGASLAKRIANVASSVITVATLAVLTITLCLLALLAMASTSFVTTKESSFAFEHTFFLPNNPLVGIVALILLLAALVLLAKPASRLSGWLDTHDAAFQRAQLTLVALAGLFCVIWLAATQPTPRADQSMMLDLAHKSLRGDWSAFAYGGYLDCYRNQIGIFWLLRLFARVFGNGDVLAFELVNVLAAMAMVWELGEIARLAGGSRLCQLTTSLLAILFFPMLQYVTFVYGNVLGLALSLAAIRHEMRFFGSSRPADALAAAVLIGLATCVKGNYAVFLIGMLLYALIHLPRCGLRPAAAMAGLLLIAYIAQSWIPLQMARRASGQPLDQGCSSWGWIAMGAQETDLASGWWNNYNWRSYQLANHNTAVQAEAAKQELATALNTMQTGEGGVLGFFLRKTASQWNNPTFEGFWIVQAAEIGNHSGAIAKRAMDDAWVARISFYLNVLQTLILFGAIAWAAVLGWNSPEAKLGIVLAIVFVGGFACHLIWEAKCQYTLPYFELLIPLTTMGYARLAGYALGRIKRGISPHPTSTQPRPDESRAALACKCAAFACAALLCVALCVSGSLDGIRSNTAAFNSYLQQTASK